MADDEKDLSDIVFSLTEAGPNVLWLLVLRGAVLPFLILGYALSSGINETGFQPGRCGGPSGFDDSRFVGVCDRFLRRSGLWFGWGLVLGLVYKTSSGNL